MDQQEEVGLPLDGNAAAGILRELFALDVTAAEVTCQLRYRRHGGRDKTLRRGDGRNISLRSLRWHRHAISPYVGRNLARHARLFASIRSIGAVVRNWHITDSLNGLAACPLLGVKRTR